MKNVSLILALVTAVIAMPLSADAKIDITGAALVSVQDIDLDRTNTATTDEDFNFNDPRVNLYINGDVSEMISVTADVWVSNDWTSENTFGNASALSAGVAAEVVRAFVTVRDVGGSGLDLKVGRIDIPFGWEYTKRTNNGDDSRNDFITNSLLDINGRTDGLSLMGSFDVGATMTPLSWEIALMNGEGVNDGSGARNEDLAWALRAEVGVMENLTVQGSWYTNDQTDDTGNDPLTASNTLMQNALTTAGNLAGLVPNGASRYDRDLWEISGTYDYGQGYVMGFWGNVEADTNTANASREFDYFGVAGRYDFDDNMYLAARWNQIDPDGANTNNQGDPTLFSIGGGYKMADNAMLKAEWTSFDEDGDAFGAGANANDNINDDADLFTVSLGVSF